MNKQSKNFSDAIIYGLTNILQSFLLYLQFFISKNISINDFGLYDFILTIINFVVILISFGQESGIARYFNELDKRDLVELISQSFLAILFFNYFLFISHFYFFHK